MTPAPITPRRFGTSGKASAPMLSHTIPLSTGTPGRCRALEPVAMITYFASTASPPTSSFHASPRPVNFPWPVSHVILFLRNRNSMPPVIFATMASLRAIIFARSTFAPETEIP